MAWKWIDNPAGNDILYRLRLYDPADFNVIAARFAQLAVRALLVALGAGSACSGSGPATTATNPAAGDLKLAGDVTGLSSNNQVNGTHLSSPLPVSQGGTGTSSAAATTVFAGPTSASAAAPGFRSLTLSDLPNISPGYVLGNATASAMAPSAVMGTCTAALMSTTNTAAQNVTAYTTAASVALKATFGNVCLPPGGPHWLGCPTGSRISAPGLVRLILRAARRSRVYPESRR